MENVIETQGLIESILKSIPKVEIVRISVDERPPVVPDLLFLVTKSDKTIMIGVECKPLSLGEPRYVRSAIQQLKEPKNIQLAVQQLKKFIKLAGQDISVYGVVAAPCISEESSSICRENGMGYIDLAGNCFLNFDGIYIERKGFQNGETKKRPLKSIFSPRAGRILRVMLSDPKKSWKMQELSNEAKVSLGLAFKVKEKLLDMEYGKEEKSGVSVARPEELLEKWSEYYSFRKNKAYDYFTLEDIRDVELKISKYCKEKQISYALALFSGLALVAPFARYTRGFVYVKDRERIQEIADAVGLKKVDSGPNFTILEPYDEGVFYGAREINDITVSSDIQLYLDLIGYKGRGEESAKFLFEQRIKNKW